MKKAFLTLVMFLAPQSTFAQPNDHAASAFELFEAIAFAKDGLNKSDDKTACYYMGMAQVHFNRASSSLEVLAYELPEVEILSRQFCRGKLSRREALRTIETLSKKLSN